MLFLFTLNKSFEKLFLVITLKNHLCESFIGNFSLFITWGKGMEGIFWGGSGAHGFKGELRRG